VREAQFVYARCAIRARGVITEEQADKQLREISDREVLLQHELDVRNRELANTPTATEVKEAADRVATAFKKVNLAKMWATSFRLNNDLGGMSWEDRRALMQMVFSGKTPDGRRMGVYMAPAQGSRTKRQWSFRILGRLIDTDLMTFPDGYVPDSGSGPRRGIIVY
jgi:hypothetical protein